MTVGRVGVGQHGNNGWKREEHSFAAAHSVAGTFTDGDANQIQPIAESTWTHTTSAVITTFLRAGLRLELFSEHNFRLYKRFPHLLCDKSGKEFRFPQSHPRLPLMYSIRMTKPAAEAQ